MTGHDAIRSTFQRSKYLVHLLTEDLSDADLLIRPAPNANHIAWQLGHLIQSTHVLLAPYLGDRTVPLPSGFAERHGRDGAGRADTAGFFTRSEYLDLFDKSTAAACAALDALPPEKLDEPNTGALSQMARTVGTLFQIAAEHPLMHLGQFSVVRRALGKPNKF